MAPIAIRPWLDSEEVADLTGKKSGARQVEILRAMKIPARVRPDGRVIVMRSDLPMNAAVCRPRQEEEPDFDAMARRPRRAQSKKA